MGSQHGGVVAPLLLDHLTGPVFRGSTTPPAEEPDDLAHGPLLISNDIALLGSGLLVLLMRALYTSV